MAAFGEVEFAVAAHPAGVVDESETKITVFSFYDSDIRIVLDLIGK